MVMTSSTVAYFMLAKLRPNNTNYQCRPKILEFKALCRLKYTVEGDTPVTLKKVHNFLFYQAQKMKIMKGEG
jgi:hypothetical protein